MQILIPEDEIRRRVGELGDEIARDYAGRPLTVVGVLTGALVFLADLIRRLDTPLKVGFVQASSYRGRATTAGELAISTDGLPDLNGRDVLLLDDILDTGKTLARLVGHFSVLGAASVRVAVLLRKVGRQVMPLEPEYVGFTIPDEFVVGYGLDYDDEYRNLPYLAVLPPQP